ncbi:sorbosone dehydrogenase family protein [Paracoccus sp. MC1862]|uniref:PQQ-dependent sugar dehydrogenase n=1 Tax=Paracoccus sp. MC1862 TaxID=2760307 RepID=UPI001602EEB3|nr:PQQ-dependent sugar dehydrogenase [Paracoccus sp. MC1862]MBB1499265.1 PQQ-dependent sugar dehydrogenase [Paracoccus sp. MC1862]QQO45835.1 PQQ-dependent sugar dehydrogenase [Paracoccus sp. MC1862]
MRTSTILTSLPLTFALLAPLHAQEVLTGEAAFGTAEDNAPGTRRHITADALPAPSHAENDPEAPDFQNNPTMVDRPEGTMPQVPEGFAVEVFAEGLTEPRVIRIAPNGDIFVAESEAGRVSVFPADAQAPATPEVFAEGLDRPFGILFHPPQNPEHVYVAAANQVVRYPYAEGDRTASGEAEVILPDIPTERHWTRDLATTADGSRIFVSIGSASNVAGAMSDEPPEEITAWEQSYGVGAAWGDEENRAVVQVMNPDGSELRNFATGLRNCSGMAVQQDGTLWCTGNERDHIGPNLAPDYITSVQDGGFYGWPWYYAGGNEDPAHAGERLDLADKSLTPEVLLQAHSSTMQLVFHDDEAFPEEYHGIFATMRGSWNRENRTGYKVVRALIEDGKPTGVYEDFMTGFVLNEAEVWGRPTGIAVLPDGNLLVSDDANGTIYRVTHGGQ